MVRNVDSWLVRRVVMALRSILKVERRSKGDVNLEN